MKKSDFAGLKKMGELNLTEHVIGGEHFPKVETFLNEATGECFQVSFKHKKFRKTDATRDPHAVLDYGDWLDFQE